MAARSDASDSPQTPRGGLSRIDEGHDAISHQYARQWSNPFVTALSPPQSSEATQQPQQHKKLPLRLRSDSGLALHPSPIPLRQYSNCSQDCLSPTQLCYARKPSIDGFSNLEEVSLDHQLSTELRGFASSDRLLPNFFEPAVIKLAFSNSSTGLRLRKFAETRPSEPDIDFLLKVEEYSRALQDVTSSMNSLSSHITTTPSLGIPSEVVSALRSNIKYCARSSLPALDRVYQDAKSTAEERLSQKLYPEFVKYQLSQCLTAALSGCCPAEAARTLYPGLGDAFCLTDPFMLDNPVVFASDGLLAMSGYRREELVGKNCRLLQGAATDPDAACRLSQALLSGREATELMLNYRPDGTPYWNLLFICPLVEKGNVRYFLGGQVNVSENMGPDYKDILGVLNFDPPHEELHSARAHAPAPSPVWPAQQAPGDPDREESAGRQSPKPTSRRQRLLGRFRRKPRSPRSSPSPDPSNSSDPTADDDPQSTTSGPRPLTPHLEHRHQQNHLQELQLDARSTPYSRILVIRYDHPTPTPSAASSSSSVPSPSSNNTRHNSRRRRSPPPSLPITFCSPHALALLGLNEAHEAVGRDVFSVLAAGLGALNVEAAGFREEILRAVASGAETGTGVRVEFEVRASSSGGGGAEAGAGGGRGGGWKGTGSASAVNGNGNTGAENGESSSGGGVGRPSLSGTLDRGAGLLSQALFAAGGKGINAGESPVRRVVGNWVPLRDGEGKVAWVVLVLTPVAAAP
ncbi:hypothetical protein C8A05DRAFT_30525 [Staphylotrichum tortipilum]|uniref:PAS domain-containing protein n=1 Tax=Staphylotrichum tortipilum TaxID=2831512 RepID=A0AAN6RW51_9PEZI|nr:hypothetical protein C8A05DRAFT_30525 [Staphylotrichum longicolle]